MEHSKFENYIIKTPETPEELKQLYTINKNAHGDLAEAMVKKLVECHPDIGAEHFLIAMDTANNTLASTISMMPWRLNYFGTKLRCLELGFVATDPQYQKRGLQRKLNQVFKEYFISEKYDISIIQGIPGFYNKLGYYYAIPLENQIILDLYNISEPEDTGYTIEKAGEADINTIASLYSEHRKAYDISSLKSEEHHRYAMNMDYNSETDGEFYLVKKGNSVDGYVRINRHGFTDGLIINEVSEMTHDAYITAAAFLKEKAVEREKPYIKVSLPVFHSFSRIAFSLGARLQWSYQWQVKINLKQFFTTIAPLLESRIEKSIFKGLDHSLNLFLYDTGIAVEFKGGKIVSIEDYWKQQEECAMPVASFYQVATGCASLEEVKQQSNEVSVSGKNQVLFEVLFPKGNSYLYCHY
jgi:predicted N-acetyltransferase YhbS